MGQNQDSGGGNMYRTIRAITLLIIVGFVIGVATGLIKLNVDLSGIRLPASEGMPIVKVDGTLVPESPATTVWVQETQPPPIEPTSTLAPSGSQPTPAPTDTLVARNQVQEIPLSSSTPIPSPTVAPTIVLQATETRAVQPAAADVTITPMVAYAPTQIASTGTFVADLIDGETGSVIRTYTYRICTQALLDANEGTDCKAADPNKAMDYLGLTGLCNIVWHEPKPAIDTNLWIRAGSCVPGDYKG